MWQGWLTIALLTMTCGCAGLREAFVGQRTTSEVKEAPQVEQPSAGLAELTESESTTEPEILPVAAEEPANPAVQQTLGLDAVVSSVYANSHCWKSPATSETLPTPRFCRRMETLIPS